MYVKLFEKFNEKWYHGSKEYFTEFKLKKGTLLDYNYIAPIFLTSDKEFAKEHAGYKTPYIYEIEVLTDNIFDYKKLPSGYNLMYYVEDNIKKDNKDYELGKKLYMDIFLENIDVKPYSYQDVDELYSRIITGDYCYLEEVWFYEWLKFNNFDGAYINETGAKNLYIFNPNDLKIINVEKLNY
jgi:hypothetical protein